MAYLFFCKEHRNKHNAFEIIYTIFIKFDNFFPLFCAIITLLKYNQCTMTGGDRIWDYLVLKVNR